MAINLSYNVPIQVTESLEENEFVIQGVAISSTVTDNQHKFLSEELQLAADSLKGRPLLKDHDNRTDSIIGRVIATDFDINTESVRFKARINQTEQGKKIKELIKSGDLNTVSIGANVREMDEEDGLLIPKGIKFKELSVVAVPADDDATFTFIGQDFSCALKEAYNKTKNDTISNSPSLEDNKISKKEEIMEKDETVNESNFTKELESQAEKLDAHSNVLAEVLASLKSLKETVDTVKESIKESVKEADVDEPEKAEEPIEEVKPEEPEEVEEVEDEDTDSEDEDTDIDEKDKYKIIQGYKSFTIERKY